MRAWDICRPKPPKLPKEPAMVRPSDYLWAMLHHDLDEEAHRVAQAGVERYQAYVGG